MSMYMLNDKDRKFYADYYGSLVGATITKVTISDDDDEGNSWPVFDVTLKAGTKLELELSQDEEGNGPGFMFGLPTPNSKEVLT